MLVKLYGSDGDGPPQSAAKYSPDHCTGTHEITARGNPEARHVSTSYAERHNLTMRMEDIADLIETAAPKPGPRGPYKKRKVS